jgi:hypothetical protein
MGTERCSCGRVARDSVDGAAWEGGCAGKVETFQRCAVGREADYWAEHGLQAAVAAPADVAADEVRVTGGHVAWAEYMAGEDAITESRRESFDLLLKCVDGSR